MEPCVCRSAGRIVCYATTERSNMAIKTISTRVQICGRSEQCHGGHSCVEQSSYIGRTTMVCQYNGETYYPKYTEDLVETEVMLCEYAPDEYKDPAVLWNAVEMCEKGDNAQLARTYRVELPNEWSYALAGEVMRDFIQRNFVDKGMCAQFAIHDSENKVTGQRNLHCHILLTMRGIDENGNWMPKQRKEYCLDDKGERIPIIDKKTGLQKVDSRNRKQWKCKTIPKNDWGNKENAKIWRKDLVDTINSVNEKLGMTENFWEHRSFEERGLDIVPEIHLGEKASALERAGVHTIRGDINRDIRERNLAVLVAKAVLDEAQENLEKVKAIPVKIVENIKNEILDMIHEVARRYADRLRLPIVGGKYLRYVGDRSALQSKEKMENFVKQNGLSTFEELREFKAGLVPKFDNESAEITKTSERISYLKTLIRIYEENYEPYIKFNKERWAQPNYIARKMYEHKHTGDLMYYDVYRDLLKSKIIEPDKKITIGAWRKELAQLEPKLASIKESYSDTVIKLASCEIIEWNKKDLERVIANEKHKPKKNIDLNRRR